MKLPLLLSFALAAAVIGTAARKQPQPCQPYADKCPACSDCRACHWCHDKGGTCSVCLEKGKKGKDER